MSGVPNNTKVPHWYNFHVFKRQEPVDERTFVGESPQQLTCVTLRETITVKEETLESIKRMERVIEFSEVIGEESKQQLSRDQAIIEAIDAALEENASTLRRAMRDVNWLRIQLQKDKLFCCLFFTVVILSVAAIIVSVVHKREK